MTTIRQLGALVLACCSAYDPWFPNAGEVMCDAWGTAFMRYNLDLADLMAAVDAGYGSNPGQYRPLPGDIAQQARAIRRDRTEREDEDARQARIAKQDARPEVLNARGQVLDAGEPVNEAAAPARAAAIGLFAGNAGQLGDPYDTCIHLPCPRCHAERDAYCTNPVTGRSARCPCLRRLSAAEVAA